MNLLRRAFRRLHRIRHQHGDGHGAAAGGGSDPARDFFRGIKIHIAAQLGYRPKNPVTLSNDAEREEVEAFLEAIDADDDVQNVYAGLAG